MKNGFASLFAILIAYSFFSPNLGLCQQQLKDLPASTIWKQGDLIPKQTKLLNYNPLIYQDGLNGFTHGIDELRQATIFTVYIDADPSIEQPIWKFSDTENTVLLTSKNLNAPNIDQLNFSGKGNMIKQNPQAFIHTYTQGMGWERPNTEITEKEQSLIFKGQVAEFIVFERILKPEIKSVIESSLALKYGITLAKDYVNSTGDVIWKLNDTYANRIAGIARDDQTGLYQKQSGSFGDSTQFTIALNKQEKFNHQNKGELANLDFLIWSDNGLPFVYGENQQREVKTIQRKWLLTTEGQVGHLLTEVTVNMESLGIIKRPNSTPILLIDRSGRGDFSLENAELITPDNLSSKGVVTFKNVKWDPDRSNTDVFTFGEIPNRLLPEITNVLKFEEFPNPTISGQYHLSIALAEASDITLEVYDIHQRLLETRRYQGQSHYQIPGVMKGARGTYTVVLKVGNETLTKQLILQ